MTVDDDAYERRLKVVTRVVVDEPLSDHYNARQGLLSGFLGVALLGCGVAMMSVTSLYAASGVLVALGAYFVRMAFLAKTKRAIKMTGQFEDVRVTRRGIETITAHGDVKRALIRAEDIAAAYFQPRPSPQADSICCADSEGGLLFEAEIGSDADGERFLRALGHDAKKHRVSFRTSSPFTATIWRRVAGLLTAGAAAGTALLALEAMNASGWTMFGVLLVTVASLVTLWTKGDVDVGVDGLLLRWMGKRRFIPYASIRSIAKGPPREIELTLTDGKKVAVAVPPQRLEADVLERQALMARIEEARRLFGGNSVMRELARRVARGARDVATWRADLAKLRDGREGYREAATRDEDLWRIVEDPRSPEDARAAAAVLLRGESEAHPRLRIAAQAVASPKLRVVLETVADPAAEERAVDEALEELQQESRARS